MIRFFLVMILSVLFVCPALGQEKLDPTVVKQLLRQLEDRERSTRDEAEKQLREMGVEVLTLLPKIDARTSGEMKQRLLRIRKELEQQQVTQSASATRMTLQGKMTLSDAFSKIEEQTGNTIVDYRARFNQENDNTEVELDLEDVPFWDGLDQLLDEAGLTLNSFVGESRKLAVIAAADTALPRHDRAAYVSLFRIEPTGLTAEKNLRDAAGDTLRMGMEVVWEPRVLPVLIRLDLDSIELTADSGETIGVGQTGTREVPVQPGVAAIDMQLPLDLPSRDVKTIKSLKGQFTALVPGGTVSFEFKGLDKATTAQQRKGGLTVILDQVRRNGGVQQISIRLRFDEASESLQSHLDWVENNVVKLIDANGQEADEPGFEKYLERPNEVGYSYLFPVDGDLKGWTLLYETPAGIAEIPVEYELQDIPLP